MWYGHVRFNLFNEFVYFSDFAQMFDVDHGYCYTYNPQMSTNVHNMTRAGAEHGKR